MTTAVVVRPFRLRPPSAARFGLVVVIAVGYGTEILFQPGIFEQFAWSSIAGEAGSIFTEYVLAGTAMLVAIGAVERRATPVRWVYLLELLGAVVVGAAVGVALWTLGSGEPVSAESAPFLVAEVLRLTSVGAFLAVTHGLASRIRAERVRERELQLEAAATRADTDLAQLRLLEAQIEPHFLFNTIANLRRTWHVDRSLGVRMHDNAIRYLEASLPRLRLPTATLQDELNLTRAYLELLSLRMGDRLRFSIDVAPALGPLPFPRMSLLTLVENSIKHGLAPSPEGGTVQVSATADATAIVLRVADDGVGFGAAGTSGTGVGLANIRSRLRAQYGRAARLDIDTPDGGGVVASIRVPRPAVDFS